jgi:hypothetical protein
MTHTHHLGYGRKVHPMGESLGCKDFVDIHQILKGHVTMVVTLGKVALKQQNLNKI